LAELLKIGIVFLVIIALTLRKVRLWISLLVTTFLFGILFHLPMPRIGLDLFSAVLDERTLLLVGALFAILLFSNLLKETDRTNEILEGFRGILKDIRLVIALLPAIIGMMPLVGGALVSAPMVVEGSDELRLSPERRTFINYWFRHVWEYILPTFPALVLAATLIGIPVRRLGWINLPLTPTAILSGALVGFWGVSKSTRSGDRTNTPSGWRLFKNLLPLLAALTLVVAFKVELAYAFGLTILGMVIFYRVGKRAFLKSLKESLSLELILTVAIVMGFKKVLESSQALPAVSETLVSSGIPFWLIAMLVPLLIGVMTGMTIAPIAIGFPILIPIFQNDPDFLNYMMLAFASGIGGDLLSPFHLCLILTKDFFQADLRGVYRFIWIPVVSLLAVGLLVTFIR
jgi:integral membrane protein (TIGR00529 family)